MTEVGKRKGGNRQKAEVGWKEGGTEETAERLK